ncbi:MAG: tetratricopeptide repeat protein [Candidatus Geothermincolia bacterium]
MTWQGANWAFRSFYASNWHPLTWLSHMLDIQIFGLKAGGHHLTSILLHVVDAILLLVVFRRMTGALWPSFALATLFAIHPLHVESVAWVAERKDVLSTFFWLLTILAYLSYTARRGARRYILVLVTFAIGLTAKPMLVTLPLVLLLLDYWPLGRFLGVRVSGGPGAWLIAEKIPLLLLSTASAVITLTAQSSGGGLVGLSSQNLVASFANAIVSCAVYLLKTVWPTGLAVYYPLEVSIPWWRVAGAALGVAAISLLTIAGWRKRPYLVVGWIWYLVTLLPVLGIVQVGWQARADRYTYVPLLGVFIMLVWGTAEVSARLRVPKVLLVALALAATFALSAVTWLQIGYWRTSITLFERALQVTEANWFAHSNLGVTLIRQRKYQEAARELNASRKISPEFKDNYYNLGIVYGAIGLPAEAVESFKEAVRLDSDYVSAHQGLLMMYERLGNRDLALQERRILQELR